MEKERNFKKQKSSTRWWKNDNSSTARRKLRIPYTSLFFFFCSILFTQPFLVMCITTRCTDFEKKKCFFSFKQRTIFSHCTFSVCTQSYAEFSLLHVFSYCMNNKINFISIIPISICSIFSNRLQNVVGFPIRFCHHSSCFFSIELGFLSSKSRESSQIFFLLSLSSSLLISRFHFVFYSMHFVI